MSIVSVTFGFLFCFSGLPFLKLLLDMIWSKAVWLEGNIEEHETVPHIQTY